MPPVELLIKPVSWNCNLTCEYCFYRKKSRFYPRARRMDDEVLKRMIHQVMQRADGGPCMFSWQGGEPLLAGKDFFERVFTLQQEYGKPGQHVGNAVQTNGTLLDADWSQLFEAFNVLVGVSLDGPPEVHDRYRKDKVGCGTYERVIQGLECLHQAGTQYNVLATLGRDTMKDADRLYRFFSGRGIRHLQFIPAVDRHAGKITSFSPSPSQYGEFLCHLFDAWWSGGHPDISIRLFDMVLEVLLRGTSSSCMFRRECGDYVVVEANGDVYPCDFFVRPEWCLGNLLRDPFPELMRRAKTRFGRCKTVTPSRCAGCEWSFLCHNGCLWFRWVGAGRVDALSYMCAAYRRFFSFSMERFRQLQARIEQEAEAKDENGIVSECTPG